MICSVCSQEKIYIAVKSKQICKACYKNIWEKERLPILIQQGYYGYCKKCNKPKKLKNAEYCSLKCLGETKREKRPEANRVCKNCAIKFRTNPAYIARRKSAGIYCSRKCLFEYRRNNLITSKGKDGYLHKNYNREHRLVLEKHLGRKLEARENVHHLNGIKTDNRIKNLLIVTNSQHTKIHHALKRNKPITYYFSAHDKIEYDRELSEKMFKKLRP